MNPITNNKQMKKNLLNSLLVTLMVLVGGSAWADGSKRVLDAQNYESATSADWTSPNGTVSLKTGDATYGNYAQVDVSGNGNRSAYKTISYAFEPDGYTTADMTTKGYVIEFDMRMAGGRQNDRSAAQFILPTIGPNIATNALYSGSDFIFALSQPTNTTGSLETTWYINDLSNTNNSITLTDAWYHYKLVVSEASVEYSISKGEETPITGSLNVTALPKITGFFGLVGRTYGRFAFDNLEIYDFTANATALNPTFTLKTVSGANRIYTIANPNSNGTLYYTTTPAEQAPAVGDAAYTASTEKSIDVTISEAGNYYAYAVLEDGTTTSAVIAEEGVTVGEITLPAPTYSITAIGEDYNKTFTVSAANNVLLTPTVKLSYVFTSVDGVAQDTVNMTNNSIVATEAGIYVVTSSAKGYTSSEVTIDNTKAYKLSKTIDFTALTAENFSDLWQSATGGLRDKWTSGTAAIPADATYYTLANPSAETATTALEGITFANPGVRQPQVYIGYGLYTPYDLVSGSGNYLNLTINGATEKQFISYSGLNNYGSGTFTTVLAGNAVFGLYRYDTMLQTAKVYDEVVPPFDPSTAITNADFSADEPIAQKICTYAKDVQEGQVANMQPLTGWTIVENGDARAAGVFAYGSAAILGGDGGNVPAVGPNGEAEGKVLGLEAVWSATTQYTQEVKLPAGEYLFEAVVYNAAGTGALSQNLIGIDGTYCTTKSYPVGKWTKDQVKITLAEEKTVTVSLGVNSGNVGNGSAPHLFIDHVKLYGSEEIAAIELAAAKENALAEVNALTIGEVLFTYPEASITTAKSAIESATTIEEVNTALATVKASMTKPAADKEYVITNKTAELALSIGNEAVKIEKEGIVKFTEVAGGWVLSNNLETPEYVFKTTGNTWTLSTTANKDEAYVVNFNLADGAYTIQGANGLFGTDDTAEGSAVFANKAQSNNGLWTIAEYVAPEPVKTDYSDYIVNADLTGEGGFDATGTKGISGGIVKVGSAAAFDFKQTIANLPAGQYKVTAQAAYRYGADEAAEAAAIAAETDTKLVQLYATVGEKTVSAKVQNRYDGASETNLFNGEGGVSVVNEKYVPNSSDAVKAWFAAGKYVNEVVFNLPADGAVTIGINRTGTPESDYTVIGPWTLTRLGDADAEPEPEPEVQPGQDMTKYITNPSFETGNTNGWTYETSNDHGAKRNDNGTYTMTNCDGDYLFNIWSSGNAISQKIENLPNGTYLMKAVIATDANQQVQLNANGKSIKIDAVGKETGVEGELEFDVLNNTATIGAEGVNKYWYKVDNFRLTYVKGFDIAALKDIYKTALAEAQAITGNMSAEAKLALTAAIAVEVDTTDASSLITAANTLTEAAATANASVAAYAKAKAAIDAAKAEMAATNVYTTEALEAYKAVYDAAEPKYQNGSLTDDEAKALENPTTITGWHDATIVDNFLLSAWDTNPDFQDAPYYINTWSTEGNNDGSNFKVPFFEYWTGDANSLGAKTLTATMNSLPAGDYDISAWVRVRIKNGAEAPATGITLQANDGEAVNVAAGDQVGTSQMYLKEFTATGTVAEDGVLKIKFNVAADNNISWLSFKNVKFEKKPFKPEAIEGALYSWESPEGLPGEYGGKISYENGDGNRLNYQNSGYYTICLNGKKANLPDTVASANAGYMLVTLDEALSEGDTIYITAYVNKNESGKKASAYILFDNGANVESGVYSDESNIALVNGVPTEKSIIVTEAMAGAKSFKMTRGQTGTNLFITKFVIMKKKKVEPVELAQTLNVERYAGLGYTAQEATVDFTEAKAYLGVEEVTTEMLRIVNPNDSLISDYAPYDGWFNGEGAAETWGANTKVCVKFFQAIPEGKFEICDMNGADSIGATYTVKWALVANDKQVTYTINVKFVEKPVIDLKFADLSVKETKTVTLTSELGKSYEGLTADVDVAAILTKLGVTSLNDVTIYAVQRDGTLDDNYKLGTTDGWRDSAGNWQTWGDAAYFYVKADFSKESAQIYDAGGMDGKNTIASWNNPFTYTATYAFVKTGSNDAVVLDVTLRYTVPTGINAIARDAQKNVIFNLNGQKVNKAQKGLFIINGKKVVNK